jgi:nucleotide-binding universal stress UspA family protein
MFSTILVPLDGSPESNVSLPVALALAQSSGGSIWLLRVVTESVLPDDHAATHEAGQTLERIATELASSGVDVHPVIREGDAAQEIVHLSRDVGADLIVMRTRGRAGLERAVFGSVAEEVLQKIRIPLVLVRPGGRRIAHIRKLLVPVDGSPGGAVALQTAVEVARATGASIKVVEVVARMARGVADAIVETAEQATADMIVMSTQALTGPARALLGSVADAVVRTSQCPVLLVHRGQVKQGVAPERS